MTPCPKPVKRSKLPRKALARSWMRKRARSRRQEALTAEDKLYLEWVARRTCVWRGHMGHVCGPRYADGPVLQNAHFRDMTGASRKEGARWTIRMCVDLHTAYDETRGPFFGMSKPEKKDWFRSWVRTYNAAYDGTVVE